MENTNDELKHNPDTDGKPLVSGMYVNEDGFLMVGPDGKSTSIVEGIRCEWADTDTLELLIQPINDLGGVCGTYYR